MLQGAAVNCQNFGGVCLHLRVLVTPVTTEACTSGWCQSSLLLPIHTGSGNTPADEWRGAFLFGGRQGGHMGVLP